MRYIVVKAIPPHKIRLHFENYDYKEPQPYIYENGVWRRAIRLVEKLIPLEIELNEDPEKPELRANIYSDISISEEKKIVDIIRRIFNADYDLKPLYDFMDSDPVLKRVKDSHYGLIPPSTNTVYEAVIKTIIQQQISLRVAYHMTWLLIKRFGDCIKINNNEFWEFPLPEKLARAPLEELRECKLSRRKSEYIIDFSKEVHSGRFDPESLKKIDHEEIVERLTQFRGLGRWSAELITVTSIGFENVNPAGDLGARKAISQFYGKDEIMSENEVRKFTEKWGKYKGIITYYLIAETLH